MKKLIILFLITAIALSSCSSPPESSDDGNINIDSLKDFRSYISRSESPADTKEYLDSLIDGANSETSDALIMEYLNYMESLQSSDLSYSREALENSGFKFISVEGHESPVIDYHFIDAYSGQISQEISDFAEFMALNSDKPWAMDAGIIIPLPELGDRIALAEQFIVTYPESALQEKVLTLYGYYLSSFLGGLDNTPLIQYDTNKVDPEYIDAYRYFIETYSDSLSAETVKNYQAELEASHYNAPYTYGEYEKRDEFKRHIDEMVTDTVKNLIQ